MSPPWMPLYIADYLKDTAHLGALESGAYLHLIMHYWAHESLPSDDRQLARIARMEVKEWAGAKATIVAFFQPGWTHKRIDEELAKAAEKTERRQEAGRRGGVAKAKQTASNASDLPEQKPNNALASSSQPQSSLRSDSAQARVTDFKFEEFYEAYPKHVDRKAAEAKHKTVVRSGVEADFLIAAAKRYALDCKTKNTDFQYIKSPLVWLNKGCWDDELSKGPSLSLAPPPAEITPDRWREVLRDYCARSGSGWHQGVFGPDPEMSNCRCPVEILREFFDPGGEFVLPVRARKRLEGIAA